jgi:prepilin-type N-terminal cleavage/methylation domain-containing protein
MALVHLSDAMGPHLSAAKVRRGFSATEMLVTMGILAVLIGISTAVLSGTRRARAQAQCAANLHSIGIAFTFYNHDYQGSYPFPTPDAQWEDLLRSYTPRATFRCAADNELFAAFSSSYDWRDTGDPNTTLAGRMAVQVSHSDLSLAFDALPEWHQKGRIQVLSINNSVELISLPAYFTDIQRSPLGP